MTDTTTDMQDGGQPTRRRATRPRTSDGQPSATRTRSRRARPGGDDLVASLTTMVDQLIEENRQLKRDLTRAERTQGGGDLGQATRTLAGLQRRVSRALETARAAGGRRGAAAQPAPRPRRKVTDPEVLERRRQALAKARAARQAKRQAQASG